MLSRLSILFVMSMRNLASQKIKNLIVGSLMFFGTFLVVLGTAMLGSIEDSMEQSITSSLSGHIQVYSKDAKDPLALFGGVGAGGVADVGEIEDFSRISQALMELDNIKAVVPMAIGFASSFGRNEMDKVLNELRDAVQKEDQTRIDNGVAHIKQMAGLMLEERQTVLEILADTTEVDKEIKTLTNFISDSFWNDFKTNPLHGLDTMDSEFSSLAPDAKMLYIQYVATDPKAFSNHFDRFEIVAGEMIPEGKRGLLLSNRFYEKFVKNKVARELDEIQEELEAGKTISSDSLLENRVDKLQKYYGNVVFQLDVQEAEQLIPKIQKLLPEAKGNTTEIIKYFLAVNDDNFSERYTFFYDEIAPLIDLHEVSIGEILTLQSFTKRGYLKSVNVKLYGTYKFKGLEKSDLAGASNLIDLITFRELYGKMTEEQQQELSEIRKNVGITEISKSNAEDALFGGGETLVETTSLTEDFDFDSIINDDLSHADGKKPNISDHYTQEQLHSGLVLNAAVILKDPDKLSETMEEINLLSDQKNLNIQAIDWQEASGIVGQFIFVFQLILFVGILIIFLVALVIINNTMLMTMLERTSEIGTMRAIGAQRVVIMVMVFFETLVLGLLAGGLGAGAGAGLILTLGHYGIPASHEVVVFFFGGPKLFPSVGWDNISMGVIIILFVSVLSTLYPALVATRIQPVVAMRGKE